MSLDLINLESLLKGNTAMGPLITHHLLNGECLASQLL